MPVPAESPPKRMTRARAKAAEETKRVPSRQTKITTPGAKAAAISRTAKRKTCIDGDDEQAENPANRSPPPPQPQSATAADALVSKPAGPASMRTTKASATNTRAGPNGAATRATRGRPKKNTGDGDLPGDPAEIVKQAPTARATRTRGGSVKSSAPPAKSSGNRKKVTFQGAESDKENAFTIDPPNAKGVVSGNVKGQNDNQLGLTKKPMRRSNTKSTTLKSCQKIQELSENGESKPALSPKKNAQVSVTTPPNEVDLHLTTPLRGLQNSPKKIVPSSIRRTPVHSAVMQTCSARADPSQTDDLAASVDELQGSTAIFTSPTKATAALMIISPAKRPPQSPFKGSLMKSPRKGVARNDNGELSSQDKNLALANSVISKPPKRFPMTEPRKRVAFDESVESGFTTSLFGSPARRPQSPSKRFILGSTMKAPATTSVMRVTTSTGSQNSPRRLLFSPSKNYTSALRAVKSPEASAKVHKMTAEEQARMLEDELACAPSPISPARKEQLSHHERLDMPSSATPLSSIRRSRIPIKSPPKSPQQIEQINGIQVPSLFVSEVQPSLSVEEHVGMLPAGDTADILEPEDEVDGHESEDELQLDEPSSKFFPFNEHESAGPESPSPLTPIPAADHRVSDGKTSESMTVLAERFGGWKGATPDTKILEQRKTERRMFSPLYPIVDGLQNIPSSPDDSYLGMDVSEYEDSIPVHTDEDVVMRDSEESFFRQSQISEASQEYGDENAVPIDPALLEAAKAPVATCTPARIFARPPQVIHTVYKVPLKPAADYDETPIAKPARRTYSLSGELSSAASFELEALRQIYPPAVSVVRATKVPTGSTEPYKSKFSEQSVDAIPSAHGLDMLPVLTPNGKTGTWSALATPARTPRPDLNTKLLSGAVVFVDVHTTEGADASGIFVELLTQMGARCVKQWNWNSRASVGAAATASNHEGSESTKVGITHVVFKDGGKRTMEKVREAKGLVLCVGVGWVLDCERENTWLDEAEYAIDISTVPRGGHRRRKSMEPKALSTATFSPTKPSQQEALSPTKEFLNLSSPAPRRATIGSPEHCDRRVSLAPPPEAVDLSAPATPNQYMNSWVFESMETPEGLTTDTDSIVGSPATPYFLHPQQLVQKTCPPKQTQQLFFPLSGRIEDQPDDNMRQRLLVARRKSLQWAPKVGSPLARSHSFQ